MKEEAGWCLNLTRIHGVGGKRCLIPIEAGGTLIPRESGA